MSQKPANKFMTIYGAVVALGTTGLGYLFYSSMTAADEAKGNMENKLSERNRLRGNPIFPEEKNVTARAAKVDAYAATVDALQNDFRKLHGPLPEGTVDNQALKNETLAEAVQRITTRVAAMPESTRIPLPDSFNLGFERYQTDAPKAAAAKELAYQLTALSKFMDILLNVEGKPDGGIASLDYLHRTVLPIELSTEAPKEPEKADPKKTRTTRTSTNKAKTGAQKGSTAKTPAAPAGPTLPENKVLRRYPFQVAFTAPSRAFYSILSQLTNAKDGGPFFTINSLRVENEKREAPETGASFEPTEIPEEQLGPDYQEGGAKANDPKPQFTAAYIVGNEKVKVYMDLDIIYAEDPAVTQKAVEEILDK